MNRLYTLYEIEFYLRKAAQAAGLGWGLAEEAGKTARGLAAYGMPGPQLMIEYLQQRQQGAQWNRPLIDDDCWQVSSGYLCPIITAAAMADHSFLLVEGQTIALCRAAYPLLLIPVLCQVAMFRQGVFRLEWDGVEIDCYRDGLNTSGNTEKLLVRQTDRVECYQVAGGEIQQYPSTRSYAIDSDSWSQVTSMAFETFAPVTGISRAGAGAGLLDND